MKRHFLTAACLAATITAQDVKHAANRYFDMNNYVQAVLYPENK